MVYRLVCISDTHGYEKRIEGVPEGDILIHGGDFTRHSEVKEIKHFKSWFQNLPHKHKLFIAGNHEISLEPERYLNHWASKFHGKLFLKSSFEPLKYSQQCIDLVNEPSSVYLEDTLHTITHYNRYPHPAEISSSSKTSSSENENFGTSLQSDSQHTLSIYGTPWRPEYRGGAFGLPRGAPLVEKWAQIPSNIDILVTHSPPYGIRDRTKTGEFAGCHDLLHEVKTRIKPRVHIFGHIHEGYGTRYDGTTLFVNAATCDVHYHPENRPIVIDLPFDRNQPPVVIDY